MIEVASALFAGISAVASAIQAWQEERNFRTAREAFDLHVEREIHSVAAQRAAEWLVSVAPPDVVEALKGRVERCWSRFRDFSGQHYSPSI